MWLCKFFSFFSFSPIIHHMKSIKKGRLFEQWKKFIASFFWLDPCAGGICIRDRRWIREIICVIHRDGGVMLPKWRIKRWEKTKEAALREFQEETGIYSSTLGWKIGTIRDRIRRKKITFYHIYNSGTLTPVHDEAVMWLPLESAQQKMKHPAEKKFLKKYL